MGGLRTLLRYHKSANAGLQFLLVWCLRNTFAQVGEPFAELARCDDESYREYFEEEQRRQLREWPLNGVNLFLRHHTSPPFSQGFVARRCTRMWMQGLRPKMPPASSKYVEEFEGA
jgi:hypothetical protein